MGEPERRQAMVQLVAKHTKLLQRLDRLKVDCSPAIREDKIQRMFSKVICWQICLLTSTDGGSKSY